MDVSCEIMLKFGIRGGDHGLAECRSLRLGVTRARFRVRLGRKRCLRESLLSDLLDTRFRDDLPGVPDARGVSGMS